MIHFIKYNLIGLLNTLITILVVGVLHQWLNFPVVPSNLVGYLAGAANSYVLNRIWNFKSTNDQGPEMIRFIGVFVLSYLINLGVLLGTEHLILHADFLQTFRIWSGSWIKPGYLAHLFANLVYVIVSFSLYKSFVFKSK